MRKIIISIVLLVLTIPGIGLSQDQSERNKERGKINSLFRDNLIRDDFKDTSMMYAFAFKVEVAKTANGQSEIKNVDVSDSSAYKLYKDFGFLKEIRYELFMKDRQEATFIFPIAVLLGYPGTSYQYDQLAVEKALLSLFYFDSNGEDEYTENYIYMYGMFVRTTTWVDY